jgi:hypothetical protein
MRSTSRPRGPSWRRLAAVSLAAVAPVLAACASSQASTTTTTSEQRPAAPASPAVTLEGTQPAGSTVKVDRVDLPRRTTGSTGGVVAVCADAGGRPGTCDGYAVVPNGTSLDVVIHTPTPLVAGPYVVGVYYAQGLPSGDQQPAGTAKVQLT